MNIEKLIKENVKLMQASGCKIYVAPEIPEKKLNNAISSMASEVDPNYVLAIVDTTVFGSAKDGILLVGDKMFFKSFSSKVEIKFTDIVSIEKTKYIDKNSKGEEQIKYNYIIKGKEESVDVTSFISCINNDGFVEFINKILENIKSIEEKLETTNQACPLAMMSSEIKKRYFELICNYAYSDDGEIDAFEYKEIMSIIAMNSVEKATRISIRNYMMDKNEIETDDVIIEGLQKEVDAGSWEALKLSIIKDIINVFWNKMSVEHEVSEWKNCEYIVNLVQKLKLDDEQINYIVENIKKNKEIIENRQDDLQIKKNMQELAAKAGAVGVPLAAVYLSGSVIGVSAAGMTSGLAALGMGGVLGFSSMFTGIGVAVVLGVGAYKGVKKVTGMGELEKNKQREMMLQEIVKNSQVTLNFLIEDINDITSKLQEVICAKEKNDKDIEKLTKCLMKISKGTKQTTKQIDLADKEKLICKLPRKIDKKVIEELTQGATKMNIRNIIYNAYTEKECDQDGNISENHLNMNLKSGELELVYNALNEIGFYSMAENTKAQVLGFMKGLI